ncbi:ATP-binding protein [Sphaerotilus mobilis]|uniref:histidine kinase n=1 Tax=Sphaerotilus mobilis TaxID=47994 RepID=A0A4Q7LEN7_9BURK|nr:ATP-binding protein [Sphaerotilus mobilis]RZS52926.1 C4-dicarboxylate-specific signal transduction histidine kinase [Sphaerotilus mobilis]
MTDARAQDTETTTPWSTPGWSELLRTRSVLAVLVGELAVALLVAAGLWALRAQTLEAEQRTLAALADAVAAQADSTLGTADAVLRATRAELGDGLVLPGRADLHELLRARVAALPRVRALTVLDDQGHVLATSRTQTPAAPVSLATRDFYVGARQLGPAALYIGQPFRSRQDDGERSIGLAMDWRDRDGGTFRGVVVLVTQPDFIDGGYAAVMPSPDIAVALYRRDGLRVSQPSEGGAAPGRDAPMPPEVLSALWDDPDASQGLRYTTRDGQQRLVAVQPLAHHPVLVVLGRDLDAALADWTALASVIAAFAASALLVTTLLTVRHAREAALRRASQAAWAADQDRALRARKLEALGTLAGGVAHDFNNVLAAVIGWGELARTQAADGSSQARQLDQVLQAGQRGKALVERILSFGRGTPRRHDTLWLQPVVDEALRMLEGSLPPGIRLVRALQAPQAAIDGDATLIHEAAMNLCTNAVQAMPEGGTLRVSLGVVTLTRPRPLHASTLAPGRHACLSVADGGPGIAPDVMARLFEPFFTTRSALRGTGLGLAVVHSVMADLGGAIDVQSRPGEGATFSLYFPCVDAVPAAETPTDDEHDIPRGHGEVVLVVDDEPALVELAEEMLAELGYEPAGLSDSALALARFDADPGRFDLVLTDELMPGLCGTALACVLRERRPDLPIVLASGYGGPQLDERAAAAGITVRVAKPLTRAELARAVAQALSQSGPPKQTRLDTPLNTPHPAARKTHPPG